MLWGFDVFLQNERYPEAAFHLHQAAESCYQAVLRISQDGQPGPHDEEEHDLEKLSQAGGALHQELRDALPRNTPADEARFQQLRAAYVDARFDKKYRIARNDLLLLATHVRALRSCTERICNAYMATLTSTAAAPPA